VPEQEHQCADDQPGRRARLEESEARQLLDSGGVGEGLDNGNQRQRTGGDMVEFVQAFGQASGR
jgi:hypothetical protein